MFSVEMSLNYAIRINLSIISIKFYIFFHIANFILALDPAFPLYMLRTSSSRLSPTDARFVDVIHTDGGFLGFPWPLGHADFFPNGGVALQPGCAKQEIAKNRWINVIC